MRIFRTATSAAIGVALVLGVSGAAFAASAIATGNVNVRSGPSAQYQRVDSLRRNQVVEVTGCRDGWCYIEKRGNDGWVSANYLQPLRQQSSKPSVSFSFNFGSPPVVRPPRPHQGGNGGWDGNGPGNGHGPGNGPGNGSGTGHGNGPGNGHGGNWNNNQGGVWNNGPRFPFGN